MTTSGLKDLLLELSLLKKARPSARLELMRRAVALEEGSAGGNGSEASARGPKLWTLQQTPGRASEDAVFLYASHMLYGCLARWCSVILRMMIYAFLYWLWAWGVLWSGELSVVLCSFRPDRRRLASSRRERPERQKPHPWGLTPERYQGCIALWKEEEKTWKSKQTPLSK
jgi:hypothetical protein